ncbi:FAD-binding oxidoreductase [Sphingobacterium litopenaei]|uniref:FAD-binding oxidoreductase n=1 Tax=Sphingobacterium litopenaei TaxID=2763500 RepID=A0ABR7YIH7_9SPHI|nr:FAD-binding protein [Sphingobacterium litopenaei]MBD1431008.1 FAD-binding oxidoreductase [Sphingobacterium litopenaei]
MKLKVIIPLIFIAAIVLLIGRPFLHLIKVKWTENIDRLTVPNGYTNDASRQNLTKIVSIIHVEKEEEKFILQLQSILKLAKERRLPVSIAGGKFSMGGHTMYPNGIVINMLPYNKISIDTMTNTMKIGAGATWSEALSQLDKYNRSIKVMQAFSSFSIGGSISVNGHGWQPSSPPVSSSIKSLKVMTSDGRVILCSSTENQELFKLIIGGYGLFAIILEAELEIVRNSSLQYSRMTFPAEEYLDYFSKYITNNEKAELVYGRLDISKEHFLQNATLNIFSKTDKRPNSNYNSIPTELKRLVFRGTVKSNYGKQLRTSLEYYAYSFGKNQVFTRNQLLDEQVDLIENKDSTTVDILQEYFIPNRNFNAFIKEIQKVLPHQHIDLLNITIRDVAKDTISYMCYAQENVFGFVFLFNQPKTKKAELEMKQMTQKLSKIAIDNAGTFYFPYRLHNEKSLLHQAYPQSESFFGLKKKYDPQEILKNKFYDHYK